MSTAWQVPQLTSDRVLQQLLRDHALRSGWRFSLSIIIVDVAGNASSPSSVEVDSALLPDPSSVAPPLDRSVVTDFATATAFLYSGNHPIQTGLVPGTLEPRRVSVLRGQVLDTPRGTPGGGKDHDLGTSLSTGTRSPVPTACSIWPPTVEVCSPYAMKRSATCLVQRAVQAPWRDYAWLPDVVMIAYDEQVTSIELSGSADVQAARGSSVTDERGSRQATLLFAPGTQAVMTLPDGRTQSLQRLHVRATEYTVGPVWQGSNAW